MKLQSRGGFRLAAAISAATFLPAPAIAADTDDLERRVSELENQAASTGAIRWSGLVEVEASSTEDFSGSSSSGLELATVELGAEAAVNDYVSSNVVLLFEEGGSGDVEVDVGTITVAAPDSPWSGTFGRQYVPFGVFATGLISDPLTLEIGETQETAALAEFGRESFHAAVYAFNGDSNDGGDDEIEQFGVDLGYRGGIGDAVFDVGAGYISSIADSDTLGGGPVGNLATLDDYVGGYDLYFNMGSGPFSVIAEYLAAADSFAAPELAFNGDGAEPAAYQLELGYGFDWDGMPAGVSVSAQGTDEAVALGLPETRLLAGVSVEPWEATSVSLELASDEDYDTADGGSGNSADSLTVQLATGF